MSNQYQKKSRVKKRFIPNILTLVNMFLGFLAIVLILNGDPMKGGIFILIAAILYCMTHCANWHYRTYNIHIGAMFGTIMAFNVWF